ncbi:hypothetical protein EYF80_011785 [Liparis tanakae]|uniref:Uncharacterized protein n=1 Tax=Liparis tanakae TaxID=230148 RepID=A0A4Z2IJU2_9TELE|nr:hypothetical protein EYF80_011785 [Liparis tanakae]
MAPGFALGLKFADYSATFVIRSRRDKLTMKSVGTRQDRILLAFGSDHPDHMPSMISPPRFHYKAFHDVPLHCAVTKQVQKGLEDYAHPQRSRQKRASRTQGLWANLRWKRKSSRRNSNFISGSDRAVCVYA